MDETKNVYLISQLPPFRCLMSEWAFYSRKHQAPYFFSYIPFPRKHIRFVCVAWNRQKFSNL